MKNITQRLNEAINLRYFELFYAWLHGFTIFGFLMKIRKKHELYSVADPVLRTLFNLNFA